MDSPKKSFGPLDIAVAAFNICQAWAAIGATLGLGIAHGGPPALIYGLVLVTIVYLIIALSAAELAANFGTAGGQYHWTAMLAPRQVRRQLSYACGCINIIGWIGLVASATIIPAQIICGIIKFYNEAYEIQRWHVILLYQAVNLIALCFNIFAIERVAWTYKIGFAVSVATFFSAVIACLSLTSSKQSSASIWTEFQDRTGWNSVGIAFMTGLVNINFGFAGLDGAVHLAEECATPMKTVPLAILNAVLMNFITTFVFFIATFYCVKDWSAVVNTPTLVPLYEMWYQGTGSKETATVFISSVALMLVFTSLSIQQTASRLTWSFARDNGILGAEHLKTIHPRLKVPVWALLFDTFWVFLLGCIYLGSSTAFNAIVSPGVILEQITFAIPAILLLWRRREPMLFCGPMGPVLGNFGWIANFVTVAWAFVELVFYNMPAQLPATAENMNYSSAVLVAVVILILMNWKFHGKRHYQGPTVELSQNDQILHSNSARPLKD